MLAEAFDLIEEWGYADRLTGELRTLDLVAFRQLLPPAAHGSTAVRLLIECKLSRLPFVFFKSVTNQRPREFPSIQGLRDKTVLVDRGTGAIRPALARAQSRPFFRAVCCSRAATCATFSKVVRKGSAFSAEMILKEQQLSACRSADLQARAAPRESNTCRPTLTLAVCVLDAPIVIHDVTSGETSFEWWVRVVRREGSSRRHDLVLPASTYAIDFVHLDFFTTFISEKVVPFDNVR